MDDQRTETARAIVESRRLSEISAPDYRVTFETHGGDASALTLQDADLANLATASVMFIVQRVNDGERVFESRSSDEVEEFLREPQ